MLVVVNVSAPFIPYLIELPSTWRSLPAVRFLLGEAPFYQVFGLMWLAEYLGADVIRAGLLPFAPRGLGWVLLAIPVLLTLAVHYTLASFVSWYYHRRKA